jgi:hypothetical protein
VTTGIRGDLVVVVVVVVVFYVLLTSRRVSGRTSFCACAHEALLIYMSCITICTMFWGGLLAAPKTVPLSAKTLVSYSGY